MNKTTKNRNTVVSFPNLKSANTFSHNEDTGSDAYADSVWESVIENCTDKTVRENLQNTITPRQRKLAMMRADGYSDREIVHRLGMKTSQVTREIEAAGNAVRSSAPELLELIAA